MILNCVVSNIGATMYQIMESTDDVWWFWTAFYPIMEATVIDCFFRQEFQWGWSMSWFTNIFCVSFADGFTVLLLHILYFLFTGTLVLYFVLTETCYVSTGIYEPIDQLSI